jgi:serine phosphatase RsbU (regulator of sigma subunit)
LDDLHNLQTRQLKARLESIATAGEILRVSLGGTSLSEAVRTLLLGLVDLVPCRALCLFEVAPESLRELGRLVEGEEADSGQALSLDKAGEPVLEMLRRHRHAMVDSLSSLVAGAPEGRAILIPFEGRLGGALPENAGESLQASHLLWIDEPESADLPSEVLDTLIALASQAGVLLTGFRYRDDLERTYSALREANHRLQRDIDRAKRIQEGLLPHGIPQIAGLEMDWRYLPAEKVSGDYFDCFPIDPDRPDGPQCLVIADVSGHGISASMVMVMFKVLLKREIRPERDLTEVLRRLNRTLLEQVGGIHFVTVFLATLDPATGSMEWCSAGHCPQLILRADGSLEELMADGVFVGMFDDFQPESRIAPLSSGDTLLLYTDGITEAEDPTGELFGMDRLKSQLSHGQDKGPKAVLDGLLGAMSRFEEGLARQDDLTLVAVRVS